MEDGLLGRLNPPLQAYIKICLWLLYTLLTISICKMQLQSQLSVESHALYNLLNKCNCVYTYYLQKVIFGAPDGPDPPDGAGAGVGGQGEVGTSTLSPAWPADHFYV